MWYISNSISLLFQSGLSAHSFLRSFIVSRITEKVTALALPVVENHGCTLWDVEYTKEAGNYYLRVFIDKEGGVGIDDCETISRELDPILDEADPIPDSYVFEVGSAGADRELKRPSDFETFMGSEVEIKTYGPVNGQKMFVGELVSYSDGDVTVRQGETDVLLKKAEVAQVRLHVSF